MKLGAIGCNLALADIDSGLNDTLTLLPSSCRVTSYELDVSERELFRAFVHQVMTDHRHVNILINNAGIVRLHPIKSGAYDDYEAALNVNLWGILHGCKEFLRYWKTRPQAWLVNMSSGARLFGTANYNSYNTSKSTVRGLTESLRNELRCTNNRELCVPWRGGYEPSEIMRLFQGCRCCFRELKSRPQANERGPRRGDYRQRDAERQGRIVVGRDIRLLDVVARLFPVSYDLIFAKLWSTALR